MNTLTIDKANKKLEALALEALEVPFASAPEPTPDHLRRRKVEEPGEGPR